MVEVPFEDDPTIWDTIFSIYRYIIRVYIYIDSYIGKDVISYIIYDLQWILEIDL